MVTSRSVPQQTAHIFSALAGQNRSALRFSQIGQNHDTSAPQRKTTVQQNTLAKDETQKASRARFWPNCPQGTFRGLRVPLRIRQTENTHFQAPERFIVVGAFFILVLGISALCDIRWLHFFSGVGQHRCDRADSSLRWSARRGFSPWTWPYFSLVISDGFEECGSHTCPDSQFIGERTSLAAHAMMTLLWKRRAARIKSRVPRTKRARPSVQR